MLNRARRIVNPLDFKRVVRRGARVTGSYLVVYLHRRDGSLGRAGFIVAKSVGGATVRNLVKRRLRSATSELLPSFSGDLVVRALPSSAAATYDELHAELVELVGRAYARGANA